MRQFFFALVLRAAQVGGVIGRAADTGGLGNEPNNVARSMQGTA